MCVSDNKRLTVWFGKEIEIDVVKAVVRELKEEGYNVNAPFYIGYNITDTLVLSYLKNSLNNSDALFLIGEEGSLLESISKYSDSIGKPIIKAEEVVA